MTRQILSAATLSILAGLAAFQGGLGPAAAQDAAPPHEMLAIAWNDVEKTVDGTLSPEQHVQLNDLAYSAAVDSLCAGFDLDKAKFIAGFERLKPDAESEMTPQQIDYFEKNLLVSYGLIAGLFLAEGALDTDGFCGAAEEHRSDPEFAGIWAD